MSVAIIINPIAGGSPSAAVASRVRNATDALARAGERGDVFVTTHIGHARELAADAMRQGARLVVAWGGDGTLNEVASAAAFSDVAVGIVPAGSGNGLARELGVPLSPRAALDRALRAAARPIDVGEIAGRLFVNIGGIGLDAHVASRFASGSRRGFLGYAGATARALVSYVPAEYRIGVNGDRRSVRAVLVTFANSPQFGNGARIAPGARVDDGLLDLVVFEERSRFATVCALPRLFNGTAARARGCRIDRIAEATVEADAPLTFHVDGEPAAGGTLLRARVHPRALQIAL